MDAKLQKWFDKYEYEYQGHRFIDCELDVLKELIIQSIQSEGVEFLKFIRLHHMDLIKQYNPNDLYRMFKIYQSDG